MGEGKRQILGALGVVALLGSAVFGLRALEQRSPSAPSGVPTSLQAPSPDAAFAVQACEVRPFDESPALAVVFTQPLDGGKAELDKHLRVTDLGPLEGKDGAAQEERAAKPPPSATSAAAQGRIVRGSWTLGDNPRIAYFPNIQPQRRYRIEVAGGLKSVDVV
ncbi:MAG: hypothetical protein ACK5O3_11030, partial [Burkholderiales bacterium]